MAAYTLGFRCAESAQGHFRRLSVQKMTTNLELEHPIREPGQTISDASLKRNVNGPIWSF